MKRSAAILGNTPPFLRWTIVIPCPFRDPAAKNQTNAAFRELRSLRAIAVGETEKRIIDGICVHPDVAAGDVDQARGFPTAEVYAAYGGKENAESACRACPANVPISSGELAAEPQFSKAGCFGWLPFEDTGNADSESPNFMGLMESGESCSDSIVEHFEAAIKSIPAPSPFPTTAPAWFGVWSQKQFSESQLRYLIQVCEIIESNSIAWQRLVRAISVSLEHNLDLRVDLTPAGFSDGVWWTIKSCCATCGVSDAKTPCEVCGSKATPLRRRKTKVLGFRPYLNLTSILGEDATAAIVDRFGKSK